MKNVFTLAILNLDKSTHVYELNMCSDQTAHDVVAGCL